MRCPDIDDLPKPPPGKTGWPWTDASRQQPEKLPNGREWPLISVVTPSYNQGHFLEETIRSVLLQGYPAVEYIVMDGGSSDKSIEILTRYSPWLAHWQSGRDLGQADAINGGFRLSKGQIFNWINSDDFLLPGALARIGLAWKENTSCLAGSVINHGADGELLVENRNLSSIGLVARHEQVSFHQPGLWLAREAVAEIGCWDADLDFVFDLVFMITFLARYRDVQYLDYPLVSFRLHRDSKTGSGFEKFERERLKAFRGLLRDRTIEFLHPAIRRTLQEHEWWQVLADVEQSEFSGLRKAARICAQALLHVPSSLCRPTLGAIRRTMVR